MAEILKEPTGIWPLIALCIALYHCSISAYTLYAGGLSKSATAKRMTCALAMLFVCIVAGTHFVDAVVFADPVNSIERWFLVVLCLALYHWGVVPAYTLYAAGLSESDARDTLAAVTMIPFSCFIALAIASAYISREMFVYWLESITGIYPLEALVYEVLGGVLVLLTLFQVLFVGSYGAVHGVRLFRWICHRRCPAA